MDRVCFEYENLEDAQYVYDIVTNNLSKFDWGWADADWGKNFEALRDVCHTLDLPLEFASLGRGDEDAMVVYTNIDGYKIILAEENKDLILDYSNPLDVVDIIDELMGRVKWLNKCFIL